MAKTLKSRLKTNLTAFGQRFSKDTSGQFAVIFGIAATLMVGGVGFAVDTGSKMSSESKLQDALDAVALIAARQGLNDSGEIQSLTRDYVSENFPGVQSSRINITDARRVGDTVYLEATNTIDTTFSKVWGVDTVNMRVNAAATYTQKNLDISLVLDNTGSMAGPKLAALKDASNALVDILYTDPVTSTGTQVGLVPFASWVNVGTDNFDASWIDETGQSPQNDLYFDRPVSRVALYSQMNVQMNGCVENRLPPFDVDDTAPSAGNPRTLFQPAFYPDMSDVDRRGYTYVADNSGGNPEDRLRRTDKYNTPLPAGNLGPAAASDTSCSDDRRQVTPLTNNVNTIRAGINRMYAQGWTNIANGASWGFRVISPNAPFTQGRPYTDDTTLKAMVVLTDGQQTISPYGSGNLFDSAYTPFGFLGENRMTGERRLDGRNAKDALDAKLLEVCAAAKSKDIVVYAITFELDDAATQNTMRSCATSSETYFDVATAAELRPAFENIASSLGELRLAE